MIDVPTEANNAMRTLLRALTFPILLAAGPAHAAEGDVKEGEKFFKNCRTCHEVGPEAKNKLGPVLNELIGRRAGTVAGFNYSPANKKAGEEGWIWSEEKLLKYIENPREAMPGNRMAYAGAADEQDRLDVVAYLKTFSK